MKRARDRLNPAAQQFAAIESVGRLGVIDHGIDTDPVRAQQEQIRDPDRIVLVAGLGPGLAIHRTAAGVVLSARARSGTAAVAITLRYNDPGASSTHSACSMAATAARGDLSEPPTNPRRPARASGGMPWLVSIRRCTGPTVAGSTAPAMPNRSPSHVLAWA